MDWIIKNVEWIFSGVGVAVIGFFFARRQVQRSVQQNVKGSSNVTQVGGDVNIGSGHDGTKR